MKEAAGEANLTVIAIVLIGVVAAVVTPMISGLMSGQGKKACCQGLGGVYEGGTCYTADKSSTMNDDMMKCVEGGGTGETK